ncbi:hypothetical protein NW759_015829 [Fusarium solani]|nr:hypothetical protein NW759_015829 [Fusarium solani]
MLYKNILPVLASIVAASASPAMEERATTCPSGFTPVCCNKINSKNGVGIGCVITVLQCSPVQVAGCCKQDNKGGINAQICI